MTAEKHGLGSKVALCLLFAMLVVMVGTRLIGKIDPPPYRFVPVLHGDAP